MSRVLLLDLGGTLEANDVPFPFVPECLAALSGFETANGAPLPMALVSDWPPAVPFDDAQVAARFADYLALLAQLDFRRHFEPVEKRVTLSTHANLFKPDRRVFELALTRLGAGGTLADCLFVTENAAHIAAARDLGMAVLDFAEEAGAGSFADWPLGLLAIAAALTPGPGSWTCGRRAGSRRVRTPPRTPRATISNPCPTAAAACAAADADRCVEGLPADGTAGTQKRIGYLLSL